jgi:hypothetical protein
MWEVKDHVTQSFTLRIPTVYVLLSTLFQKCVTYFTAKVENV